MPVRRIIKFVREQYESLTKRFGSNNNKKATSAPAEETSGDAVHEDPVAAPEEIAAEEPEPAK